MLHRVRIPIGLLAGWCLISACLPDFTMGTRRQISTVTPWPGPPTLDLTPAWTWWHREAPDRAYTKARLLDDRVVGPWFSLDRATGQVVWQVTSPMPNSISRLRDGMIIGTEVLAYGPTTGSYGVYGIELDTGHVAWIHHRDDWYERDPATIELIDERSEDADWRREGPSRLVDDGVVTSHGRVLDLETGELLRTVPLRKTEDYLAEWQEPTELWAVGAVDLPGLGRLLLGTGETLAEVREHLAEAPIRGMHSMPTHMGRDEPFGLTFESPDGEILWQFDLDPTRYWIDGNAASYALVGHFAILVVAEPEQGPTAYDQASRDEWISAPFSATVLDLRTGTITATLPLGDRPAYAAQIEALDERGLLLSADFDFDERHVFDRLFLYIPFAAHEPEAVDRSQL
ncbi:MAG: hypothetical protein AAGE94_14045 [Acidobacteriota bacterium]